MKKLLAILIIITATLSGFSQSLYPDLFDNSNGIANGYGAWGTYQYVQEAEIDVNNKGKINFYHPNTATAQYPVIFFISGWGRECYTYDKFFKYLTSLGYSVVNIYNYSPGSINTSYQNSLDMMQTAVTTYSAWIDTSKVGLMGHSYGGGSTIWLGKQVFDTNGLNWGANGRLIMTFAPWLSFLVTDTDLQNYPAGVKLLMIQSNDDLHSGGPLYNTDPRALRAVYQLINIPDSEKDFVTIFSDNDPNHAYTFNGTNYTYLANHYVCYTGADNNPYDALDVYSSNRLADALLSYVFEGDMAANNIALGNGSAVQKDMGVMPDLAVTDYYITTHPESDYEYKCSEDQPGTWGSTDIWKLQAYCDDADGDGVIDALSITENQKDAFLVYPVPASKMIYVDNLSQGEKIISVKISNMQGKILISQTEPAAKAIDVSQLPAGNYLMIINTRKHKIVKKIVVRP